VLEIDRERAVPGSVGAGRGRDLQLALSGQRYGYFNREGKQYQVIGQLARVHRDEPQDLASIFVRSRDGELVTLDNMIRVSEHSNPPQPLSLRIATCRRPCRQASPPATRWATGSR